MKKLINILNESKNNNLLTDYRVINVKKSSYEMFFVHKKLETVRATDTDDVNVTVYVDGDNGKCGDEKQMFKGDSSFAVFPYMTENDIKDKVVTAANRAKLVKNKHFDIPCGDEEHNFVKEIASNMADYQPYDLAQKIADAVFDAECYTCGSLNAVEVFVYKTAERILNSRGIDKTQVSYRAMIEAIPTWTENGQSVELYESYNFTEFDKNDVVNEINRRMKEVKDRQIAEKPQVPFSCDVMFNSSEIPEILNEFCNDLNFASIYSHRNVFSKDDMIAKDPKGDKINISMIKEIKGSPYSALFDGDGAELVDTKIVDNGKVVNYYGSNRFAQYLGEKKTGDLVCVQLGNGSLTDNKLEDKNYLEVISMSGIQVDLYNDYIGGEIRFAYFHKDGKVLPVTGISISGKLSNSLSNMYLSNEETTRNYYKGPKFMYIEGFQVI